MNEFGPAQLPAPLPSFPDHWQGIEAPTSRCPYRLVTAPARHFLNSSFNETDTSVRRERQPTVLIHPEDAAALGVNDGDEVVLGNDRGEVVLKARFHAGQQPGVLVSESLWPNHAFKTGSGINALTGADPVAPSGGAAFHDNRVWVRLADD